MIGVAPSDWRWVHRGPISVEPLFAENPVQLKHGMPTKDDCYNTASRFKIPCQCPNGVELLIIDGENTPLWQCAKLKDTKRTCNGILFEGEQGKMFVNRGLLLGPAVEELKSNPVPADVMTRLRKGKEALSHMGNFMACVQDRGAPFSDVGAHHRAMTTCHLSNIAMRLGRKLQWDFDRQQIVGDDEANAWQSRPQRPLFEVEAG